MTQTHILGIDPGFSGGFALIGPNHLSVAVMPIRKYNGKKMIVPHLLADIISQANNMNRLKYAVIEDVASMPRDGVVSAFKFGFGAGLIHGVLAANGVKVIKVKPAVWKAAAGLSRDKKDSIKLARKLFPQYLHLFNTLKDEGKAEAAIMAYLAGRNL